MWLVTRVLLRRAGDGGVLPLAELFVADVAHTRGLAGDGGQLPLFRRARTAAHTPAASAVMLNKKKRKKTQTIL